MEGKTPNQTRAVMLLPMTPQDANAAGNVHGGVIMKRIDEVGAIVAVRHSQSNVVTASVDRIDFIQPVFIGDVVTFKASLNLVGKTSMEVGVRVESENPITGTIRHNASAFLTYVALDDNRKPREIPPLILETEDDIRRNREAQARRKTRLRTRLKP
jgi:uncharacterized protein (TIGR00369 family)